MTNRIKSNPIYSWLIGIGIFIMGIGGGYALFSYTVDEKVNDILDRLQLSKTLRPTRLVNDQPAAYFQPTVAFQEAAEKAVDAVVYISTRNKSANSRLDYYTQPSRSSGSGVLVSENGYIVTNNHVIDKANEISVILNDKTEYEAELIARDLDTDLALLKISSSETDLKFPFLSFGDSDKSTIGQWVLAVGNPFSLTSTVTAGIISAKARDIGVIAQNSSNNSPFDYSIESFIQTDAAVNPGNSGGALVNLNGELIGINTAIASETGSYAGYSFAIPANLVKKIVADLTEYGVVQRGFLGVSIKDIDAKIAKRNNLKTLKGAYITAISPKGAAEDAGLEDGDIITSINGKKVNNTSELQEQISNYRPGDKVLVNLIRSAEELNIALVLKNKEGKSELINQRAPSLNPLLKDLGANFDELSKKELLDLELSFAIRVSNIKNESRLHEVGVENGFVITKVNKIPITSFDHFLQLIKNSEQVIYFEGIRPNGKKTYYAITDYK
jgi:serine protease Do